MSRLGYRLSHSRHPVARALRYLYHLPPRISIPAPRVVFRPILWCVLFLRSVYYFFWRVLVCEPLFKAYCYEYGKRVHTDVYLHWVNGRGRIIVGDDVLIDGKISISFAARYTENPEFRIGNRSGIGHDCHFDIGKRITIGNYCRIAPRVTMFDSSGHASDPDARKAGMPPSPDEVKPITICDNAWIGRGVIVFPGVTVGEGSIVASGAVVLNDVAAYTVVAGNPARKIGALPSPAVADKATDLIAVGSS
jgi:acetyltransferase-like isoleucine patch superfamily enzyme